MHRKDLEIVNLCYAFTSTFNLRSYCRIRNRPMIGLCIKIKLSKVDILWKFMKHAHKTLIFSQNLPLLENKATRLLEARELKSSMQDSDVYKVISRPLTDESKMATSMTPLRHRLANETPTPIVRPTPQYSMRVLKVQNHPIKNSFQLSSTSKPH